MAAEHKIEARPRNWLTPVALVLLKEESSYGYELMEGLEEFGFEQISAGSLYRTLRRMEQEGLCKSEWGTFGGWTSSPNVLTNVLDHLEWGRISRSLGGGV
jgi:DNA-binding PadR family transcriptional regulator